MKLIPLLICFLLLKSVDAQTENDSSGNDGLPGFSIGIGLGKSIANGICIPCHEKDFVQGYSFLVAPGIRINKKILIDVVDFIWFNTSVKQDPANIRMNITARINYLPFLNRKLLFQLGLGAGNYFFTPEEAIATSDGYKTLGSVIGIGFACSAGMGYEFSLGKKITLVPAFCFYLCFPGTLKANEIYTIENRRISEIADVGITLRFNTGLFSR